MSRLIHALVGLVLLIDVCIANDQSSTPECPKDRAPARRLAQISYAGDNNDARTAASNVNAAQPKGAVTDGAPARLQFIPVDTSRLMGSPHPTPLKAERAFPRLKFKRPLELTYAEPGDERLFVVEQRGVIHVFKDDQDVRETQVFLDIRDRVSRRHNEEGLLGLAFHPDFASNGEVYVYYSTQPQASIVSRFHVSRQDSHRADRGSEEILLRIAQPYGNHNGGSIKFGPDGYLYVGLGDGGAAFDPHEHGQDLTTLLGSILRIDVDRRQGDKPYAIPESNPFVDRDDARGEIWAYGLRNVWRLGFDRKTGQLWAGDVGQDRFEEVDRIVKGGNYGWNRREGFHPFDPKARVSGREDALLPPVAEYFHGDGESVTGGIVYRGPRLREYDGAYFYADYLSGLVWIVPSDEQGLDGEPATLATSTAGMDTSSSRYGRLVARTGLRISAFGEDASGRMYLTAFDGHIYRLARRQPGPGRNGDAFPQTLTETGLFDDVAAMRPARGLIPYRVNVPLWSDGALKERFVALPKQQSVTFHRHKKWEFPVGTVFVKTFFQPTAEQPSVPRDKLHRLETRLFIHTPRGWRGHTYVWNQEQTEASLLRGARETPYEVQTPNGPERRTWYFPSSVDCRACHTQAAGFVLGPKTAQLNARFDYGDHNHGSHAGGDDSANQIEHWRRLKLFTEDPLNEEGATTKPEDLPSFADWRRGADADEPHSGPYSVEQLSRAYLDVNCSICHRPDGLANETPMDLRSETPPRKMALLGRDVRQGQLSPAGGSRIAVGKPEQSEILYRMRARGHRQMPPLATRVPDRQALRILGAWIEDLDAAPEGP